MGGITFDPLPKKWFRYLMTLAEITEQAVLKIRTAAKNPCRIVLFGSAARGELGPHSDLDIMVIMPTGVHRRRCAQEIYRSLADLGFAVDVVVVTEEDVRQFGDHPAMVIGSALREGRDLYVA
jgi:predicted nucleotidyltransferase